LILDSNLIEEENKGEVDNCKSYWHCPRHGRTPAENGVETLS